MSAVIEARGLSKTYGKFRALDNVSFSAAAGRIVGLIGPNGAGKTTALRAILGLTNYEGELKVLDLDPYTQRDRLMQEVCFIADVAVLPGWLRVQQAVDFVAGVHPRFRPELAEQFLGRTTIKRTSRVRELSKGMITQLHLALVMAIDAKLLVLDEPTIGLDILYRKQFYESLLADYFDHERTIVITTHQVEEVENILTDVLFIDRGHVVLDSSMEQVAERYLQLTVNPDHVAAAREIQAVLRARSLRAYGDVLPERRRRRAAQAGRGAHAKRGGSLRRQDQGSRRMNHMPLLVRREFWEHRSFVIAPAIVAAILLIGVTFGHVDFGAHDRIAGAEFSSKAYGIMTGILSVVALPYLISMGFLTVFYLLDSLYADRKDRSVLFWKSLPVSDRETVISKLVVAAVVLPLMTFLAGSGDESDLQPYRKRTAQQFHRERLVPGLATRRLVQRACTTSVRAARDDAVVLAPPWLVTAGFPRGHAAL